MVYSHSILRHASLVALALAVACSGDGGKPPIGNAPGPTPTPGDGDGDGTGGGSGDGDGTGGSDGDLAAEPEVKVSIEGGTPDIDKPAGANITAICQAKPGDETEAAAIDKSTVKLRLLDAEGEELESLAGNLVKDSENEFSAEFVLAELESGTYSITCDAIDSGGKPDHRNGRP